MPTDLTASLFASAVSVTMLAHAAPVAATPITPNFAEVERAGEVGQPGPKNRAANAQRCYHASEQSIFYKDRADECGRAWLDPVNIVELGANSLVSLAPLRADLNLREGAASNAVPLIAPAIVAMLASPSEGTTGSSSGLPSPLLIAAIGEPGLPAASMAGNTAVALQSALPMPEPASLALVGSGFAVLAWRLRHSPRRGRKNLPQA